MSVTYALYSAAISSTSTCGLSISDTAHGRIIFYLDPSWCHVLVAKATDESGYYKWSSKNAYLTWAFDSEIYIGAQNT